MWPPPRHLPIQPSILPPLQSSYQHIYQHPPDPYIDRRAFGDSNGNGVVGPAAYNKAPWHRELGCASWRLPPCSGGGEDWRTVAGGGYQPWSNHDIYRRQYGGPIPLGGRSFSSQFDRRPGSPIIKSSTEPSQIDYEKQLRENYETSKPYKDFAEVTRAAADLIPEEKKIILNSVPSARRIQLNWKLPKLPANDKFKINLAIKLEELEGGIGRGAKSGELGLILDKVLPIHTTKSYFDAIPGSLYSIELNIIGQKGNVFSTITHNERATFSRDEMMVLMQKAIDFTGTTMQSFQYLYRCKPRIYWDYVYETGQILNVYLKDSNGQAACPLNQNIEGLFFSAKTNPDGTLPTSSPFGDVRMVLPATNLLDPQRVNLYFADFYCNSVPHYVTVVVALKDSDVDRFCKDKLLPLNAFDNQFLYFQPSINPSSPLNFFVNKKVWVEIYYTDNIPMRWGRFDNIIPQGVGTSKIGGLPHNKNCRICNLYPVGVPAPPLPTNYETLKKEQADLMVKEAINAKLPDDEDDDYIECLNDTESSSSRFISYDVLHRRYERLKHAITSDLKNNELNTNPENEKLVNDIYGFLVKMNKDFICLNERINILTKIECLDDEKNNFVKKETTSQNDEKSCPISGTLKDVIDQVVVTSPKSERRGREASHYHHSYRRTRNLSTDSSRRGETESKRRRREESV